MSATAIRCPNCGGDVDLDANVCPYCNTDIICDQHDKRKKEISDMLVSARNDINSHKYAECRTHIDDIISLESDCADAWFMSAALYCNDKVKFENEMERARSCKSVYGIFGENDVDGIRKLANKEKIKNVRFFFVFFGIFVIFFGGAISLGLGLAFGTLIPLIVTIAVALVIVVIYLLVTKKYRR